MKIKYWNKTDKKYISKEEAMSRNLKGIRCHCLVTKEDLVAGNGLPEFGTAFFNADFVIGINGQGYKLAHPLENSPGILSLEDDWIGEVAIVEKGKAQGLIDVNTGEMLIPFDRMNYAIYPINKEFFCVVDPTLENKKIVNRKNVVLDSVHGTYVKSGTQLLRHSIKPSNRQYIVDGRTSIPSLRRKEQTLLDQKQLEESILHLKKSGMTLAELTKIITKIYEKEHFM